MNGTIDQYNLSGREIEVVQEIVLGQTNKECANRLFVTEKTIKFHLTNIYKKMGVKSRSALIVKVMVMKDRPPEPAMAPI